MGSPETRNEQLAAFIFDASEVMDHNRQGRIDNLTDSAHPDHYAQELLVNIRADVARGRVDDARATIDFWLENIAEDGRVPHMLADVSGIRRKLIDRHVVRAEKNENGEWPTPLSAMPVMSISAQIVASAMDENQRKAWTSEIFPKLTEAKSWQYRERDFDRDGLLSQLHPDETFFRNGKANEKVLHDLPAEGGNYRWTHLSDRLADNYIVKKVAKSFRKRKATSKTLNDRSSSYDADQFMSLKTAGRIWDVYHKAFGDFRIKDVAANALLIADNEAYEQIAEYASVAIPDHLRTKIVKTKANFAKFWDPDKQEFASLDIDGISLAEYSGAERFLALIGRSAMTEMQIERVIEAIEENTDEYNFPLASGEEPDKAHRGAMHPMINMLIFSALESTNPNEDRVKQKIGMSIVGAYRNSGFHDKKQNKRKFSEAYSPKTAEPIGADYWGPTAASGLVVAYNILEQANR